MLSLEPPYHVIKGVCLFRDHADPLQWYAMPGAPRFATTAETINGVQVKIPQLQLIKFKGLAGTGGFLNFDVDLAIDDELLEDVKAELRGAANLPDAPRVSPLPVVDGSVRMMLFDKATPEPGPQPQGGEPEEDDPLKFVLKLSHAAKPALYGDQRAAFSVQLSQEGVTVFEKAIRGELSPIGVVYQLDYLGLRPAYHVSCHVDWTVLQKHLEEHEEFKVPLFYSSSIDKVVDELIENRVIVIKVDTFDVETGNSDVMARRDEAINDIKDMITDTFFEPSLDPIERTADGDAVGTVARVLRAVGSAGMSEFSAFTKRKVDITRIEQKRLDFSMSERSAVRRSIYPQGHLAGLFRQLDLTGVGMERFVTEVDLDDPWFQRREIEVISRADFEKDSIQSVNVELTYEGTPKSVLLTKDNPKETVSWSSKLRDGGMIRDVVVKYTVNFGEVDGTERPKNLVSESSTVIADKLEVAPRQLYSLVPVPVDATLFPWDRYATVELALKYDDAANQIAQNDVLVLTKDADDAQWAMFVRDPDRTAFSYRTTMRSQDRPDREEQWKETGDKRVTIRDPFSVPRSVDVVPQADWMTTDRIFVDLTYSDDEHGISEQESFEFNANATTTQTFRVRLADVARRRVQYAVTVMMKNSDVIEVPKSETLGNRIFVGERMRGHRVIDIRLAPVDFAARGIKKVTLDMLYEDEDHGLKLASTYTFTSSDTLAAFEYDYVDGGPQDYQFHYRTVFTNNLSKEKSLASGRENPLVIDVG